MSDQSPVIRNYLRPCNPINVSAAVLGWSLYALLREHPNLLQSYVPGFIMRQKGQRDILIKIEGPPPLRWKEPGLQQLLEGVYGADIGLILHENFMNAQNKAATHMTMMSDDIDLATNVPVIVRRSDLIWCKQRLGWTEKSVLRKMLRVNRLAGGDIDSTYSRIVPSHTFRINAFVHGLEPEECQACGAAGKLYKCQKCCRVAYCNQECQRRDWPRHKVACPIFCVRLDVNMSDMSAFIRDVPDSL